MPRSCTICTHEKRSEIEAAVVKGASFRVIASQFSVGDASIQRHAASHIQASVSNSQAVKEEARGIDVVNQLKAINAITLSILKNARDAKKDTIALYAIDRVMKQLELQAKLLGDIDKPTQVNIYVSPEWRGIRDRIVLALLPYPDARFAVAQELSQLESGNASIG